MIGSYVASEALTDPPMPRFRAWLACDCRYLGTAAGDRYVTGDPDPEGENTEVPDRPERWLSQD